MVVKGLMSCAAPVTEKTNSNVFGVLIYCVVTLSAAGDEEIDLPCLRASETGGRAGRRRGQGKRLL